METSLHYDQKNKQLSFLLKEAVTADPDIQLRFRGRLNTNTGSFDYHATAQKFTGTGPVIKVRPASVLCATCWSAVGLPQRSSQLPVHGLESASCCIINHKRSLQESLTQPLRLGVGLGVSSNNNDEPFLAATATKKISLLEGDHTQFSAKARLELDPRSQKVGSIVCCVETKDRALPHARQAI